MKVRDVGLSLFGGAMVYVALAACSSGSPRAVGTGGGKPIGTVGSGHDSGLVDHMMHPVPPASADPVDGHRLKAQFRAGDDGSKEYINGLWYDSTRNETCAFSLAADGKQRCLPDGASAPAYADAACTMPILAVATGCTTPAYALVADTATCGSLAGGTHVHAVGAATTPMALYVQSGSSCFSGGPAATGFTYYSVGAEIAAASFVSASTKHD